MGFPAGTLPVLSQFSALDLSIVLIQANTMLHDPSHYEPPPIAEEIQLSAKDVAVLRRLAGELAEIAALPVHKEKARLWQKLNDLESERPLVWINEIPWHEMDVDGELTLATEHPWARDQERDLRRTLYQWRHMPGDMVVSPFLACPLAVHSTDFGIVETVDVVRTDAASDVVSRHFKIQMRDFADLEKIRMPSVAHNEAATRFRYEAMRRVYDGVLPVRKIGQTHIWYTPWDYLIRWWGIQEAMIDLVERPDLVHAGVERMVDAWMTELDQFEALNVLSLDCNNTRIGSGGYGYTSQLPGDKFDPARVRPRDMWGCSNAQIFSEVSPRMHWEFAVEHDLRLAFSLGPDLLRLLRAVGREDRHFAADSQPAEDFRQSVVQHGKRGREDRPRLRHEPQTESGDPGRGSLASRAGAAGPLRIPRRGPRLPCRADHEGHFHRPLPAAAAVGVVPDRHGSGPAFVRGAVNQEPPNHATLPDAIASAARRRPRPSDRELRWIAIPS